MMMAWTQVQNWWKRVLLKIEIWIWLYCGSERKGEIKTNPGILIGANGRIDLSFTEIGRRYEKLVQ